MNFKNVIRHPLIYGSGIVVIGGLFANFFNFLFNLFMSRNLTVADYGTLASLLSLIGFPALIITSVVPLVVRFAGDYFANNRLDLVRGLYSKISKFLLLVGITFFILFFLFIPMIGSFFHISNSLILVLTDVVILLGFITIINLSMIQAKLAFVYLTAVNLIGALVKVSVGIVLVLLGFSLTGSVAAVVIGALSIYIVSFFPIRSIFAKHVLSNPSISTKELFSYGLPSALTLLGLTSFISTDVILVKHFFDPKSAGVYAGLSLVGKVIFYVCSPVANVMFPIIVQKHSRNENIGRTFLASLALVLAPSVFIASFYFLFPKFSILFFLKNAEYLKAVPFLWIFGIFMTLYCLQFTISNFYLSIKKTKVYIPILLGAFLQIIFITFYHHSFLQIITISLTISFLLVLGLLLYYPHAIKKRL